MRCAVIGPVLAALAPINCDTSNSINSAATALTASRITSACSSSNTFLTTSSTVILSAPAIAGAPFRRTLSSPTIMSAGVAGTTTFRPNPSYTTLRDVTPVSRATRESSLAPSSMPVSMTLQLGRVFATAHRPCLSNGGDEKADESCRRP
jgi:hypothetical protein